MKIRAIMTTIFLMVFVFGITTAAIGICNPDCDYFGPHYKNQGKYKPNQV